MHYLPINVAPVISQSVLSSCDDTSATPSRDLRLKGTLCSSHLEENKLIRTERFVFLTAMI
jgi:hypothetical protein